MQLNLESLFSLGIGLHAHLGQIEFWVVTGIPHESMPWLAIWHSTPSDLSQRKMLRAAAETFSGHDQKRADILWLLDQIDHTLSSKRNEAIHAPLDFFTEIVESKVVGTALCRTFIPGAI